MWCFGPLRLRFFGLGSPAAPFHPSSPFYLCLALLAIEAIHTTLFGLVSTQSIFSLNINMKLFPGIKMDQSPTPTPTPLTTNALTRLLQAHQQSVAKQAASASVTALPSNPQLEDLPVITWRNNRFFLESHVARKGSRGPSSWIKDYGVFLIELDSNNQRLDTVWCCQLCDKQGAPRFFKIKATTTAQEHLKGFHHIDPEVGDSTSDTTESRPAKRSRNIPTIVPKAKIEEVCNLAIGFIVSNNLPFSIFHNPFIKGNLTPARLHGLRSGPLE